MNISTESMLAIIRDRIGIEITSHPKCKNLVNLGLAVDYFVQDLHFNWNEKMQAWCVHYVQGDAMIPDTRTVHDVIDQMLADPERACLLATREQAEQYVRPRHNPWVRGPWFSLTEQGRVFRHEPEQARKWRNESEAQKMFGRSIMN
ncbi:MAG: hypothetical protein EOM12_09545 [Verrucomicrobiae bacterium]|nr:hypothetical protein [Verrucomicrobiae bacterium]